LLRVLEIDAATVFGSSAGGIVAIQLAVRHPEAVRRAIVFEPGYFRLADGGEQLQVESTRVVTRHLDENPSDWAGAVDALSRWAAGEDDSRARGPLAAPVGKEWYDQRAAENAEALVLEDIPMTGEPLDIGELRESPVDFRFAFGTASRPVFRQIAARLAAACSAPLDPLEGVGHLGYIYPERIAAYVLANTG
jgi:pimeloyl-ACP methyl ester carboxylesterase